MPVRREKLSLADRRAMEKEANRENVLDGRGATPSMGLSEIRGGSFHAVGGSRTGRYEGMGHDESESESDKEVKGMGRGKHTKHLKQLKKLCGSSGGSELHGGFLPLLGLLTPLIGNMIKNGIAGKNVFTGNGKFEEDYKRNMEGAGLHGGFLPLLGLLTPLLGNMIKNAVEGKNLITGNGSGGSTGAGSGGAGKSDGRARRASIVKKIMAEKGCSMIEASRHVKANNLYSK
jgi:hypothetical protein